MLEGEASNLFGYVDRLVWRLYLWLEAFFKKKCDLFLNE